MYMLPRYSTVGHGWYCHEVYDGLVIMLPATAPCFELSLQFFESRILAPVAPGVTADIDYELVEVEILAGKKTGNEKITVPEKPVLQAGVRQAARPLDKKLYTVDSIDT